MSSPVPRALGRVLALIGLILPALAGQEPAAGREPEPARTVPHVRVGGALDLGTLALLTRGLDRARGSAQRTLVLELETPGGSLDLMWQFSKALDEAHRDGVRVVAWVHRQALSAGVLVALSCDRIVMTENAVIGAAQPVLSTPFGARPVPDEGGLREKISSAMRAEFRAMAEERRRPGALAEAMVDPMLEVRRIVVDGETRFVTGQEYDDLQRGGERPDFDVVCSTGELLTLTSRQALAHGFADGLAESLEEVLRDLGLADHSIESLEARPSEQVLGRINEYAFLLLAAALLLAYTELKMPGFGLPGILSAACFVLLLVGRHLVGLADVPHLVAAVAGLVLIGVELFLVPGTLWAGVAGALLLVFALVFSALGPGFSFSSPLDRELLADTTLNFLLTAVASLAGVWAVSRFLPETPVLRRLALGSGGRLPGESAPDAFGEALPESRLARVGALGEAVTDLRPVGKVRLDGDPRHELEARSAGAALDRGRRVRVVEVSAGRLVVEPLEEGGTRP